MYRKIDEREEIQYDFDYFNDDGSKEVPFHLISIEEQVSRIKEKDFKKIVVPDTIKIEQHEHEMKSSVRSGWGCNGRYCFPECFGKTYYGPEDKRWRCHECDFDFCEPCA